MLLPPNNNKQHQHDMNHNNNNNNNNNDNTTNTADRIINVGNTNNNSNHDDHDTTINGTTTSSINSNYYNGQRTTAIRNHTMIQNQEKLIIWILQQPIIQSLLLLQQQQQDQKGQQYTYNNYTTNNTNANNHYQYKMHQFGFGQSNPTYKIDFFLDQNTNTNTSTITTNNNNNNDNQQQQRQQQQKPSSILLSVVVRQKPLQIAHPSAHALHREYRVLQAIQQHNNKYNTTPTTTTTTTNINNNNDTTVNNPFIVPVPNVYCYCKDISIIGSEFYIMEYIKGRVYTDPTLPDMTIEQRQIAYNNILTVLAAIHTIPYQTIHALQNYGSNNTPTTNTNSNTSTTTTTNHNKSFIERQLERLVLISQKQSKLSGINIPEIETIVQQLLLYVPYCPTTTTITNTNNNNSNNISTTTNDTLIHGDFKIDNIIFHPTKPIIIGIIDWELSTIGDPMCDVANLCMMYYTPRHSATATSGSSTNAAINGLGNIKNLSSLGIPTRKELINFYCQCFVTATTTTTTTTDSNINNIDNNNNNKNYNNNNSKELLKLFQTRAWEWSGFYLSFLFFKNCIIVQGVAQRYQSGNASSSNANTIISLLPQLIHITQYILKHHPPPITILPTTTTTTRTTTASNNNSNNNNTGISSRL